MTERWDWTAERELASQRDAHLPFVEEVMSQLTDLGWEGRDHFGVLMTLEETLTNAIRHGNSLDPEKRVRVGCRLSADRFWLQVEDEGEGFRPDLVPDCTEDENLEAFGGRGMALINAYMAEVTFNERGNQITVSTHRGYTGPVEDDGQESTDDDAE